MEKEFSEEELKEQIERLKKKFGILDEGPIVSDDDYEFLVELPPDWATSGEWI